MYITRKILSISIYCYEYEDNTKDYRFLYNIKNENNFISYYMILNHVYLNKNYNSEHFELIKINM